MESPDMESPERIAALEARLAETILELSTVRNAQAGQDAEMDRLNRRVWATWTLAVLACIVAFVLGGQRESVAQTFGVTLQQLASRMSTVEAQIASVAIRTATLESKTQDMSRITDPNTGMATVQFSGVNVQIVNGSGITFTSNGVGNLIIGYNEKRPPLLGEDIRSGSHYLVVGQNNNYTSYGGIIAGLRNSAIAPWATVTGGTTNTASGEGASVTGGSANTASGSYSSITGGNLNHASGDRAVITGGEANISVGLVTTIMGSTSNTASGGGAVVCGGSGNVGRGWLSSIIGGKENLSAGENSSVTGGYFNRADGELSTVSGGSQRTVNSQYDWRAGGLFQDN